MAKRYKLSGIQKWMDSQKGQTFLNFAYSWGASVVILGALFKLTHISGADIMLFLGMGTEVIVFFLAGFEHQTAIGEDVDNAAEDARNAIFTDDTAEALAKAAANMGNIPAGGTVYVGGGAPYSGEGAPAAGGTVVVGGGAGISEETAAALANAAANLGNAAAAGAGSAPSNAPVSPTPVTIVNAAELAENISTASAPVIQAAQFQGMTPDMQKATTAYVQQLTDLTETLKKVAEQSARLTRDSEEMENMNRTLTGINRFYELQLKSVGSQSATIDDVNEQTKRLASQLQELNEVYAKMVEALKMKIS
ncbi:MAG: gliding motility protein GldL [Bacteroidaceae bacterium]|nr:gliding motility protein GldL [Bacteroidaceae bacterium]